MNLLNRRHFLKTAALVGAISNTLNANAQAPSPRPPANGGKAKKLFHFDPKNVIRPKFVHKSSPHYAAVLSNRKLAQTSLMTGEGVVTFENGEGGAVAAGDDASQFSILQLKKDAPEIVDSFQIDPAIQGSSAKPDVQLRMELGGFHLAKNLNANSDTRGTLRVVVNKSDQSTDKTFNKVFWVITAGLKLYDQQKNKAADPKDMTSDLTEKAFGGRPVEIPGGLADLSFQVVKHKDPSLFEQIWNLFKSEPVTRLLTIVGFPAIAQETLSIIDDLLNNLVGDADPDILFESGIKQYALSKYAKDEYIQGYAGIKMESLNPGWWIMVRGQDYADILKNKPVFDATLRKLIPASVTPEQRASGNYQDPFANMTYAVFRVGMAEVALDPKFRWGV